MKIFIGIVSIVSSVNIFCSTLQSCKVIQVINVNIFEESLSVDEYPNVSIEEDLGSTVIHIGANKYETDGHYIIQPMNIFHSAGSFGYEITDSKTDEVLSVSGKMKTVNGDPKKIASISYKKDQSTPEEVVANLLCD